MKATSALPLAATLCAALIPDDADATIYSSKHAVTEINGFFDPNISPSTWRSMIASGEMAAVGLSNATIIPALTELQLLSKCQVKSPANTLWMGLDKCSPDGLDDAMSEVFPQQAWLSLAWGVKTSSLNEQVIALYQRKSPSTVPLFGEADNWGTLVRVDATLGQVITLTKAWFFSACPLEGEDCFDGLFGAQGSTYINNFYLPVLDPSIGTNDPYYGKWPMIGGYSFQMVVQPKEPDELAMAPQVRGEAALAVLDEDEVLTASMASELVFDALDLADLSDDPSLAEALARGVPGLAHRVSARLPGALWSYVLVPLVDPRTDAVLAMVALSERGGAFEFFKVPSSKHEWRLRSPQEAVSLAQRELRARERLSAPRLEWSATCGEGVACRSPDAPSFVFDVGAPGRGTPQRRISIPLVQRAPLARL